MPNREHTPSGPKLLVVEDDDMTRRSYEASLANAGYRTCLAADGLEALEVAHREAPDVILLDVDIPRADGWQTLATLRQEGSRAAVIMLTGLTAVAARVRGLNGGADDYICKPCDHGELIARVQAVLRRNQRKLSPRKVLQLGPTAVDLENRTAIRAGAPVGLTRTEFALLELLAARAGHLVTRGIILEQVWGYGSAANTRTVETHVWRLRRKLGDQPGKPRWIQTVPAGGGYRLVSDGQLG